MKAVTKMPFTFVFREITEKAELEHAFRMRYHVYQHSENKAFIRDNEQQIDIDGFDLHSKHFGFFRQHEMVGYVRAIFPAKIYTNPLAEAMKAKYGTLIPQTMKEDYPFLSYENVPASHFEFKRTLEDNGDVICEASRFIIHPRYQSSGAARLLIESSLSTHIQHEDCSYVVINCCPTHERFYTRYGIKNIDDNRSYTTNGVEKITLAISMAPAAIPEPYREYLLELNNQYRQTQQIVMTL